MVVVVVLITRGALAAIRADVAGITIAFGKTGGVDYARTVSAIEIGGGAVGLADAIAIHILVSGITDTTAVVAVFVGVTAWVGITRIIGAGHAICAQVVAAGAVFAVVALVAGIAGANDNSG